jgi:hypothetical protein
MKILPWALTLMLASCATAPGTYNYEKSKSYSRTYDQIWEDLVGFFSNRNIQIKNIAKDSGVIYAETSKFDEELADCGDTGLASVVSRTVNLNVFVMRSEREPKVNVNTKFTETRRSAFDRSIIWTVECNSKGVIERAILESVRQ